MTDDTIDARALQAARLAAPGLGEDALRAALEAYLRELHIHVSRIHAERDLSPAEVLDAFKPRDVTVEF